MESFTEENYLKAIFNLLHQHKGNVPTNSIAEQLGTKAASVTDMLKKLAIKKLIQYEKYRGVQLTAGGRKIALAVVRKHRLWEMFLVEKLGFGWDEVHEVAEQLEHIRSEKLVNEIDRFLNYPKYDPHGDPIPDARGKLPLPDSAPIGNHIKADKVIVTGVRDHRPDFLKYLESQSIQLGTKLQIVETNSFDGSMLIRIGKRAPFFIGERVCSNLLVRK